MSDQVAHGMVVRQRGAGPPLLWIHGLGESGRCFRFALADPRLRTFSSFIPDLPGYGRSPAVPRPDGDGDPEASLAAHADTLAAWWRSEGAGPATVIGHSMGAIVALHLAERHPDLVEATIDVEGNKTLPDCAFSSVAARFDRDAFREAGHDELLGRVFDAGRHDLAQRHYFASMAFADPDTLHADALGLVAGSAGGSFAARLGALPRAFYVPGVGAPGGAAEGSIAAVRAAGVPVHPVGPAGHWPFVDQPQRFVDALFETFGATSSPSR